MIYEELRARADRANAQEESFRTDLLLINCTLEVSQRLRFSDYWPQWNVRHNGKVLAQWRPARGEWRIYTGEEGFGIYHPNDFLLKIVYKVYRRWRRQEIPKSEHDTLPISAGEQFSKTDIERRQQPKRTPEQRLKEALRLEAQLHQQASQYGFRLHSNVMDGILHWQFTNGNEMSLHVWPLAMKWWCKADNTRGRLKSYKHIISLLRAL